MTIGRKSVDGICLFCFVKCLVKIPCWINRIADINSLVKYQLRIV